MTHDELLAEIEERALYLGNRDSIYDALRQVVELHKPEGYLTDLKCAACSGLDWSDYPCKTIQAIKRELG